MSATLRTLTDFSLVEGTGAAPPLLAMMAHLSFAAAAVVLLYLLKSAAGINVFAGPSPLHELLYHFVR